MEKEYTLDEIEDLVDKLPKSAMKPVLKKILKTAKEKTPGITIKNPQLTDEEIAQLEAKNG
jgi:hypothetical protein